MSFLSSLLTGGAGDLVHAIGDVADKLFTSDGERAAFKLKTQELIETHQRKLQHSLRRELEAKERILVAEL